VASREALKIQIYVDSKTLPYNTLVSMLLVSFAFNLALTLSLESFCLYFIVIVFEISLFHLRNVYYFSVGYLCCD
jgi:hypothetical protein